MASAVDDYVHALAGRLRGPGRLRDGMLTEVREALTDAADAYRDAGLTGTAAEDRAVAEFGPVRALAPQFQEVLAAARGRRTAWLLLIVLGVHHGLAELIGRTGAWQQDWGSAEPSALYLGFARFTDFFVQAALAAAIAAVVAMGWGTRRLGLRPTLVRTTAAVAAIAVVGTLTAGTLLTLSAPGGSAVGELLWAAPFAAVLVSARRTWYAARLAS
ncbi:hypothetical protein HDA40_006122 [Hamadaea flava]|uniref:Permease prefix domain 1-containing protein n=1 Tax=Hamadaea flava TaxID=1742688 RepID=A0ABV8LU23_9ACTN|nr:permease prefix domain 1-containing protein [Hamadaea flava]MCP2327615.1 hypothetical protein [Hamadaea flava]